MAQDWTSPGVQSCRIAPSMQSLPLALAAFVAGLASFLSPCVLPLVPGYISLISGASVDELQSQLGASRMKAVMVNSLTFIVGFTVVFVMLGAAATSVGHVLREYKGLMGQIAGAIIIIFGLHLTGILKISALYADKRMHTVGTGKSAWGSFLVGFAFAFGWTPCIGPILAAILAVAASERTVAHGAGLLAVYSLGLGIPFLLAAVAIEPFARFLVRFRRHLGHVERAMGGLLVLTGIAS